MTLRPLNLIVLIGLQAALPWRLLACPACKDALAGDAVGFALSWTTLLLIAVPMVLVGSIGGWVGYLYWRATRQPAGPDASRVASWPLRTEKESET